MPLAIKVYCVAVIILVIWVNEGAPVILPPSSITTSMIFGTFKSIGQIIIMHCQFHAIQRHGRDNSVVTPSNHDMVNGLCSVAGPTL